MRANLPPPVRVEDFVTDPDPTFRRATKTPVELTDERGVVVAVVSVPKDRRPCRW